MKHTYLLIAKDKAGAVLGEREFLSETILATDEVEGHIGDLFEELEQQGKLPVESVVMLDGKLAEEPEA